MHIERLITMANDIAAFFHGAASRDEAGRDEAVRSVATHLRNYWDPRMRRQIAAHCSAGGAGLSEVARDAVALLGEAGSS